MSDDQYRQGMLDTNILILRKWINPAELPDEMAISAITLAELSAGPHEVRRNDEQDAYDEHAERARRLEILQRAETARIYGRVAAAVIAAGRKPRGRAVDLMIAATAIAEGLPLYTTNPADFGGLDALIRIVPVTRPPVSHEQPAHGHVPSVSLSLAPWTVFTHTSAVRAMVLSLPGRAPLKDRREVCRYHARRRMPASANKTLTRL
jgi:predicted nucleic acid-binding protein